MKDYWTSEEIKILKREYPNTLNKEMLKFLPNRTIRSIDGKAQRLGFVKEYLPQHKKRFNHIDNKKIKELREKGLIARQIADILGCSKELIRKRYKEIGIKGVDMSEYKKLKLNNKEIEKLYLKDNISAYKIAKVMGCSSTPILNRLDELKIKKGQKNFPKGLSKVKDDIIRNYSEGKSTTEISKIFNCSPNNIFRILKINHIKLRDKDEALKLVWKREGYKEHMSEKGLERFKDEEFLENYRKGINRKPNNPEKIMIEIIEKNNLPFNYVGDGKIWLNGFNPDFLSKNPKHIIEIYGDYWHNLPKDKLKNGRRMKAYSSLGYKTLVIWEHELKDSSNVLNKIRNFIK